MDGSSDSLCRLANIRGLGVFRLNTDLLLHYKIRVTAGDFTLSDPIGRRVCLAEISACLWRKPWIGGAPTDAFPLQERTWVKGQLERLIREIANLCRLNTRLRLVEPGAERRLDKLTQMTLARDYFTVPEWEFTLGCRGRPGRHVVKAMQPDQIAAERTRFLYTTLVEAERLDISYPWLLQDPALGSRDATVVYLVGECHGFQLTRDRSAGPTDWRENINTGAVDTWSKLPLSEDFVRRCCAFMQTARLHYGRLDLIVDDIGNHEFLEVNSNGQFGWLDDDTLWLHERVLDCVLSPTSTVNW